MILIFNLILTFILVLEIRELTLISMQHVVLLHFRGYFCKNVCDFVNLK